MRNTAKTATIHPIAYTPMLAKVLRAKEDDLKEVCGLDHTQAMHFRHGLGRMNSAIQLSCRLAARLMMGDARDPNLYRFEFRADCTNWMGYRWQGKERGALIHFSKKDWDKPWLINLFENKENRFTHLATELCDRSVLRQKISLSTNPIHEALRLFAATKTHTLPQRKLELPAYGYNETGNPFAEEADSLATNLGLFMKLIDIADGQDWRAQLKHKLKRSQADMQYIRPFTPA